MIDELLAVLGELHLDLAKFIVFIVVLLSEEAKLNDSGALVKVVVGRGGLLQELNNGLVFACQFIQLLLRDLLKQYLGSILHSLCLILTRLSFIISLNDIYLFNAVFTSLGSMHS